MRKKIVVLYLPSEADVKRWQALAKSKSSSLSSWVFESVENSLNRPPPRPVTDTEELGHLRKEVFELKKENEQLLKLNNQLIETRKIDSDTIPRIKLLEETVKGLLQKGGTWSDTRLKKALETPKALKIEPNLIRRIESLNDVDAAIEQNLITELPLLSKAMHNLIDEGLAEEVVGGFKWKGKS